MFLKYGLTRVKRVPSQMFNLVLNMPHKYENSLQKVNEKFFKVFQPQKNKILTVHVKDKSCDRVQDFRPVTLLKRDPTQVFSCEYSKNFRNSFFIELWWLLLNYVLVYIDFQTGHFSDFEQFKVDIHFASFGQIRIDPISSLLLTLDRSQLLY